METCPFLPLNYGDSEKSKKYTYTSIYTSSHSLWRANALIAYWYFRMTKIDDGLMDSHVTEAGMLTN